MPAILYWRGSFSYRAHAAILQAQGVMPAHDAAADGEAGPSTRRKTKTRAPIASGREAVGRSNGTSPARVKTERKSVKREQGTESDGDVIELSDDEEVVDVSGVHSGFPETRLTVCGIGIIAEADRQAGASRETVLRPWGSHRPNVGLISPVLVSEVILLCCALAL